MVENGGIMDNQKLKQNLQNNKVNVLKAIIFIAVILSPIIFTKYLIDTDTYFILNIGRYTLNNGFTTIDPFTLHEGLSYIFQQWLTGVIFYTVYKSFGYLGLVIMIIVQSIIMLIIMYKFLMLLTGDNFNISIILTGYFAVNASWYMVTRPQIMSYIIVLLFILMIEKYARTEKIRYLILLPVLSFAEINLHAAAWPLLFVFSLPFLCSSNKIASKINDIQFRKIPLLISLAGCFIAGFITPYGYKSMTYLFTSNGARHSRSISELQDPGLFNVRTLLVIITMAVILILITVRYYQKKSFCIRYFLLCGGTFVMYMIALRNIVYCSIGLCLYMAVLVNGIELNTHIKLIKRDRNFILKTLTILSLAILGIEIFKLGTIRLKPNGVENSCNQIVDYMNANTDDKNLYTDFNTGGYFEFYGFKTTIDPRMELYTKKMNGVYDYYDEYIEASSGYIYYDDYFSKYDAKYIATRNKILNTLFEHDSKYEKLVDGDPYVLWIRHPD